MMVLSFRLALAIVVGALLIGCGSEPASPDTGASTTASPPVTAAAAPSSDDPDPVPQEARATDRSLDEQIADARIEARVTTALVEQSRLRTFNFTPSVVRGRLTLAGDVNTMAQYQLVTRTAQRVEGIEGLSNNVTVQGQTIDVQQEPSPPHDVVATSESTPAERGAYHTVQQGETLWRIARTYQASVDQIKSLNELRGNGLEVGQRIRVR